MPKRTTPRSESAYYVAMDAAAKAAILKAWNACGGNVVETASRLGIHRSTLYREITRLGMGSDLPGYADGPASVA